jgi:D-alanine-D-alanine ligase
MKKRIAIAAGGDSGEYEISIRSAAVVEQNINTDLYEAYVIEIRGQKWRHISPEGKTYFIDKDDFSLEIDGEKVLFDAVFIAIHGTPGEDGKLQGYLDMLGIPYTTCDHITSALTFNKYFCNKVVSSFEVKVSPSRILYRGREYHPVNILRSTGLPCFVKPNKGGSSVGMSKVIKEDELLPAIEKAFAEDDQVLVEGFIPGREITCGVISWEGQARSLPVTEIISKKEFFDYEAKYTDGVADEITPADIPDDVEQQCRATSEMLYEKLNCRGFVRFDYIYNDDGMYFLEVNTVPGLSPNSIVPQQAEADGISLRKLFSLAIEQALVK